MGHGFIQPADYIYLRFPSARQYRSTLAVGDELPIGVCNPARHVFGILGNPIVIQFTTQPPQFVKLAAVVQLTASDTLAIVKQPTIRTRNVPPNDLLYLIDNVLTRPCDLRHDILPFCILIPLASPLAKPPIHVDLKAVAWQEHMFDRVALCPGRTDILLGSNKEIPISRPVDEVYCISNTPTEIWGDII